MLQAATLFLLLPAAILAQASNRATKTRQPPAKQPAAKAAGDPELKRLMPDYDVWIDTKRRKRVVMYADVVLREGPLELFACLKGTKEHEAVLACKTKAFVVHAALLAVGAEVGHAVTFRPEYHAATGTPIEVTVFWKDAQGKDQRAKAQDWIRNVKTDKALDQDWVFAGSGFYEDEASHEKHYLAEDGDLICVSNFPSATLDLPIESSQSNEALLFDCFTARIPPIGTRVTLVLTPKKSAAPTGAPTKTGK